MKRIVCVLLTILLLTGTAYAAIEVSIPDRNTLIGEQYYVTVSISENPGFASVQMELYYDASVIRCVKVVPGDVLKGMLCDSNTNTGGGRTSAILSAAGFEDTEKNGTVATFVFEKPEEGDPAFDIELIEFRRADGAFVRCDVRVTNNYSSAPETDPPETDPPETNPPETDPPVTDPPVTAPILPDYPPFFPPFGWDTNPPETEPAETEPVPEPQRDPKLDLPAFRDEEMQSPKIFTDVSTHWAKSYIREANARGIMQGYPDNTFLPDKEMTRAEFATMLWNIADRPSFRLAIPFRDVEYGEWYYGAVGWAYEMGYINGISENTFDPGGTITREQAMTILYRFTGETHEPNSLAEYEDRGEISLYAVKPMNWAVHEGLMQGTDATHLSPGAYATRAQLAAIMVRYIHYIQSRSPY